MRFLGLAFTTPYDRGARHVADGIAWATWFTGGRLNLADDLRRPWADDPATPTAPRSSGRARTAHVRTLIVAELRALTDRDRAPGSRARGVGAGDAVGLFLPMVPETVAALLAVAKLGAIFLPIFSGYGADAVAIRLEDAGAVALVTADGFTRRGQASCR